MNTPPPPSMKAEDLRPGRTLSRIGRNIVVLAETPSTNDVAFASTGDPGADGLAVFADFQTRGRGRQGRDWLCPRGAGLLCSILLVEAEPDLPEAAARFGGRLTLIAAVAACEAIRAATEIVPAIKWPNDLRSRGRKLGGILVESRQAAPAERAWVVGMGINCLQHAAHFPPDLRETATSLELEASHAIDRAGVGRELLRSLDRWLARPETCSDEAIHAAWLSFAEPIGQPVRLRRGGIEYDGRTLDVDPAGGLIVQCNDGRREWFDPLLTTML